MQRYHGPERGNRAPWNIHFRNHSQAPAWEDRPEGVQSPMKAIACATAPMEASRIALNSCYWAASIRSEVASAISHDSSPSGAIIDFCTPQTWRGTQVRMYSASIETRWKQRDGGRGCKSDVGVGELEHASVVFVKSPCRFSEEGSVGYLAISGSGHGLCLSPERYHWALSQVHSDLDGPEWTEPSRSNCTES